MTKQQLRDATSICTMSHESIAAMNRYDRLIADNAERVNAGLITVDEAKRAIFQGS